MSLWGAPEPAGATMGRAGLPRAGQSDGSGRLCRMVRMSRWKKEILSILLHKSPLNCRWQWPWQKHQGPSSG